VLVQAVGVDAIGGDRLLLSSRHLPNFSTHRVSRASTVPPAQRGGTVSSSVSVTALSA